MSYALEFGEDGTVVYATHRGEVGLEEILSAIAEESALAEKYPSLRAVIFDYTAASMAPLGSQEIARCARAGAQMLLDHPGLMLVGVVPEPLEFGLTRMFQAHVDLNSEGPPLADRVRVVRTREEALACIVTG